MQHLNPYVHAYRHMYAVTRNCDAPAELRFHFATGITPDPRRYNAATPSSEVAVVYTGDKPPCHGLMVYPYPRESGLYTRRASYLSDHVDPLAYPLLFLDGQHGWHPQLRTVTIEGRGPEQRSNISQREFFTHRLMQCAPWAISNPQTRLDHRVKSVLLHQVPCHPTYMRRKHRKIVLPYRCLSRLLLLRQPRLGLPT